MPSILLVDDNPDDRELIMLALASAGFSEPVASAADGVEALAYLHGDGGSDRNPLPSIVLLDLMLPRRNGFDVLSEVRRDARTRLLPVVVLSSSDSCADICKAYELGANSYVRKPVQFADFNRTVEQIGTFWLTVNRAVTDG